MQRLQVSRNFIWGGDLNFILNYISERHCSIRKKSSASGAKLYLILMILEVFWISITQKTHTVQNMFPPQAFLSWGGGYPISDCQCHVTESCHFYSQCTLLVGKGAQGILFIPQAFAGYFLLQALDPPTIFTVSFYFLL